MGDVSWGGAARLVVAALLGTASAFADESRDLADLSLEELGDIEVTSVLGYAERLSDAPASIYVITPDDIRRAGVNSLPEALRLAPNLEVARRNAVEYAISARGFNNAVGNKLLVLIDGRTVYTPLFSGVFWDQQDVMLEDIERIEVISGPGATLWGANAVNGVINVITRPAESTQGALASIGGGSSETRADVRYGGKFAGDGAYRVYGRFARIDNTQLADGTPQLDDWKWWQIGFRTDWRRANDEFTVQGDAYSGKSDHRGFVGALEVTPVTVSGMNLLARWQRRFGDGSEVRVRGYYDHTEREEVVLFRPTQDLYDIDFQHEIPVERHRVLWGGGYRYGHDAVQPAVFSSFVPPSRSLSWANLFVQDEIKLRERLALTMGIKLESNDYTGVEHLPSIRLAWRRSDRDFIWSAVSRGVRAPSRLDRDAFFPILDPPLRVGGLDFQSEVANVVELGYRARLGGPLTFSITAFFHDWDNLRSGETEGLGNKISGATYGVEAWASWQATRGWRLSAGGTTLTKDLHLAPGSADPIGPNRDTLANDPDYQWQLRSAHTFAERQELDISVRRVGALSNPVIAAYTAVDARWGWRVSREVELSLTVQNLFDPGHVEFGSGTSSNAPEIPRTIFLKLLCRL